MDKTNSNSRSKVFMSKEWILLLLRRATDIQRPLRQNKKAASTGAPKWRLFCNKKKNKIENDVAPRKNERKPFSISEYVEHDDTISTPTTTSHQQRQRQCVDVDDDDDESVMTGPMMLSDSESHDSTGSVEDITDESHSQQQQRNIQESKSVLMYLHSADKAYENLLGKPVSANVDGNHREESSGIYEWSMIAGLTDEELRWNSPRSLPRVRNHHKQRSQNQQLEVSMISLGGESIDESIYTTH